MAYTTIKKPSDYFNTVTWTGTNDATTSVTGVNFKPDLVWIKNRNVADDHVVHDSVRGVTKQLFTSSNTSEQTNSEGIQSFDTDGFTTGTHRSTGGASGNGMVSWNWLGANGTTSNTDGSITSTVSANTTSGFSIVSYTGTGANATIGHGLGVAPKVVIIKNRDSAVNWMMYNEAFGDNTKALSLNNTNALDTSANFFNSTSPTSTVFSVGTNVNTGGASNFIAYCFADVQGFSKFGSYTGNGSADGTFVYTGFKPAWILIKNIDSATMWWHIIDNKRDIDNPTDHALFSNSSDAEYNLSNYHIDYLSNGFKLRNTTTGLNTSSNNYIYMAIAEEPLVGDNPATAR